MSSTLLAFAVWLTRMWTRTYTSGIDMPERDARRQEIESDLWESQHDEADSDAQIATHVLARLMGGIVDDIRWRAEHPSSRPVRAFVVVGTTGLVGAVVWLFLLAQTGPIPVPPAPPTVTKFFSQGIAPPPPPPPPPPVGQIARVPVK